MARGHVHSALGRLDDEGNFVRAEVPPEEIEEARAKAAKAIAPLLHRAFQGLRQSEAEAANAAYLEPYIRGKLEQMRQGPIDVELYEEYLHELVRLLQKQGRFGEAAELHPDGDAEARAAHRPDSGEGAWCDCTVEPVDDGLGGTLQPLVYECDEIVSEVHGGIVHRYVCKVCGHPNITPEPPPQDAWYYTKRQYHGRADLNDAQMLKR